MFCAFGEHDAVIIAHQNIHDDQFGASLFDGLVHIPVAVNVGTAQ